MKKHSLRSWLTIIAIPVVGLALTLPATDALGVASVTPSHLSGASSKVIVFLRDTAKGMGARSHARANALRAVEAPVLSELHVMGASNVKTGRVLPYITATVTSSARAALAANPQVIAIEPDSQIHLPSPTVPTELGAEGTHRVAHVAHTVAPSICGTATNPELDPQAITAINADQATAAGYTGAGVTVAYIADGVDPTNPDFQRNAAYASGGSPTGTPILTQVNMDGDPAGTPTAGGEAFLDSSSIAAQGNSVYDLSNYVSAAHPLPAGCDIKIVGSAPGANVMGLAVFSSAYDTTESNFIQAIDYAVANGAQVLNESFGSNNFPDTALDATRLADDAAVAAGVTVVVSSGDAGVTSTQGSPATDPNVISVGASTTDRAYAQLTYGGINDPAANGTWLNDNISSISSGGFSQAGANTMDLVAPGDSNWALCTASTLFQDCRNESGAGSPIEFTGGTSESSPLTAGAAADVIQAYASTHGGTNPTPALVKQILMSSATDISAPAVQQGAGLLNVLAAVNLATSITGTTGTPDGGLLVGPNQINIVQPQKASTTKTISVTNTSSATETVDLSTRALTKVLASPRGSFCLNPSASTIACGPPTANTFPIWSGVTEVYQNETFNVPAGAARLNFSADYPYTGQGSLLHVALIDPSGAYAGYSLPQGLADYANVQVANPAAGAWTAVFFTEQNGATPGGVGTSGTIQWFATSYQYKSAGLITPPSLVIAAGATKSASLKVVSSNIAGDQSQSVVLTTVGGATTTIPVTVRTLVSIGKFGGYFGGVLTGGNGRGNPGETSTFQFNVPSGEHNLYASTDFADTHDEVVAYLLDPAGDAVASSSSVTQNSAGTSVISTGDVNVYADSPQAGRWTLVLDWLQPVSGAELSEPFTARVAFNLMHVTSNLPTSASTKLVAGTTYTYHVTVTNPGTAPQAIFLDPRTTATTAYPLLDINGSDQNMSLPLPPGTTFPIYFVPADTTNLIATLAGSVPVTFDAEPFSGDPDLSPNVSAPNVLSTASPTTASVSFAAPEIFPGLWFINPSEYGPYGSAGEPAATASSSMFAVTKAFDPTVTTSTGDLWADNIGLGATFAPKYMAPGTITNITFAITPSAASGTQVSGRINVSDTFLANEAVGFTDDGGDQLASLPFTYTVK